MGNLLSFGGKTSNLEKRWHSTQSQFSFSSVHSNLSVASAQRPWSRTSRRRWHQSTLLNAYESSKTAWPVPYVESLFLPEFSVKGDIDQSHFVVEEQISRGAFGFVFKVRRKEDGEYCAMKILSKAQVIHESAVQQCKDEVTIQSLLGHHPLIVQCLYHWQDKKNLYIVTKYIPHGELLNLWKSYGKLPEEVVRIYIAELATAIDFLNNNGVVYRDLKMENILLDNEGHIQLIDFGLAKWVSHGSRTATICGTLQYMAPEILSMQQYSHTVDWWSLGIIMFTLLAGHFPIESVKNHTEMLSLVEIFSYELPPGFSDAASRVVRKLLCKIPQKRLQSLKLMKLEPFFCNINFDSILEFKVSPLKLLEEKLFEKNKDISSDSNGDSGIINEDELCDVFAEFPWVSASEVI